MIKRILLSYDSEPVELLLALWMLASGIRLALPLRGLGDTQTLTGMTAVAPLVAWAVALGACGLVWLSGLAYRRPGSRQLRQLRQLRRYTSMAAVMIWGAVTGSVMRMDAPALVHIVFPLALVASGWVYLRLGMERRAP